MLIKKNYESRLKLILFFFLFLFIIILIRLFFIQIYYQSFYTQLAQQQYGVELTIPPDRAVIYDRDYKPLAINQETASLFALPFMLNDKRESSQRTLAFLKSKYPDVYDRIIAHPEKKFIWVARQLTKEEGEALKEQNYEGLHLINESKRFYPYPSCSHVLGFTDIDNTGIAGIELQYNDQLRGIPALHSFQKDARSGRFYFEKNIKEEGKKGTPLVLSLDSTLQFLAQQELITTLKERGSQSGAVIIMDPLNGEILSMATYPEFNPSQLNETLIENTKNVAVTDTYELGSVMKIFSTFAAFDAGVVTPDELVDCHGKATYFGKLRVENWKSLGILPFSEAVRQSSNVATATIALRTGSKLYDYYRMFGFGDRTGIKFPGERIGFVNHPKQWSKFSPMVLSFGYEITGTLLQLARAMSMIANGGYDVKPTLVKKDNPLPSYEKRIFKPQTIELMKNILQDPTTIFDWVYKKHGLPGYRIIAKTGTARCVVNGQFYKDKHRYTFAGIIEKGDYKRVIITFATEPVKKVRWASEIVAPLFMQVAEKMVIHETGRETSVHPL